MRTFQLYSDGVRFFTKYEHQPYLVDVRARSLRQAIFLAANRRLSIDGKSQGIIFVDHNEGPTHAKKFFTMLGATVPVGVFNE